MGSAAAEIVHYAMGGPMHATGLAEREPLKLAGHLISYHQCGAMAATATMAALLVAEQSGTRRSRRHRQLRDAGRLDRPSYGVSPATHLQRPGPDSARRRCPGSAADRDLPSCRRLGPGRHAAALRQSTAWRLSDDPELAEVLADPGWVTNPDVPGLVDAALYAWLAERTTFEAMVAAQPHHWPITALRSPLEVVHDDHFAQRGAFSDVDHPVAGRIRQPSAPVRFAGSQPLRRPAPLLGQHNDEVRATLDAAPPQPTPLATPTPTPHTNTGRSATAARGHPSARSHCGMGRAIYHHALG